MYKHGQKCCQILILKEMIETGFFLGNLVSNAQNIVLFNTEVCDLHLN